MRSILVLLATITLAAGAAPLPERPPMPQFSNAEPAHWFNSEPLQREDLTGKVVLIDVWTFGCWNCYRSFPWLKSLEERFAGAQFQVIGIHTPEFDHEADPDRVAAKILEFGLQHPVMMDNDFAYWRALDNRYWPTFYLVDKQGRLRFRHVGETHAGDSRAQTMEQELRNLLAE